MVVGISWESCRELLEAVLKSLGVFLEASWGPLGAARRPLGASWGPHLAQGSNCRLVFPLLGLPWGRLGAILGCLGSLLSGVEALLGHLATLLGPPRSVLGRSWGPLELSWIVVSSTRR